MCGETRTVRALFRVQCASMADNTGNSRPCQQAAARAQSPFDPPLGKRYSLPVSGHRITRALPAPPLRSA
jgi:hypothetical protein